MPPLRHKAMKSASKTSGLKILGQTGTPGFILMQRWHDEGHTDPGCNPNMPLWCDSRPRLQVEGEHYVQGRIATL